MPAITTNSLRRQNSSNFSEAYAELDKDNLYVFIGKSAAWTDENLPDTPVDSPKYRLSVYNDMIGIKKVSTTDIVPVCPRIDWTINTVYSQYDDELEIVGGVDVQTGQPYEFYVITSDYQVYKCISNNKGAQSTIRPTGTGITSFQTADGYVWKYMFTVSTSDAVDYLAPEWLPVRTLETNNGSDQWTVQNAAINGSIEHMVVQNAGTGYDYLNPPAVVITGDGSNATATPVINQSSGELEEITITDVGSDYSTVSVTIDNSGVPGSGALVRAVISSPGGHGSDPVSELGCNYRMVKAQFSGDEGGNLPLGVDYRQMGLLLNPIKTDTGDVITYNSAVERFVEGDTVTGVTSGATGTVVRNDIYNNKLYVDTASGTFVAAETINNGGATASAVVGTVVVENLPANELFLPPANLIIGSGKILYINNRTKITRFAEQDEQVKLVLTF